MTAITTSGPATTSVGQDIGQDIDTVIDTAIRDQRLVGARVLVALDGRVVHRRSAGLADRERSLAMPEDPIVLLASIAKPFTSVAAMALVESGELGLDAPIARYLPGFRPALPDGTTPPISVRQLLTHTAGLSYGMDPEGFEAYAAVGASNGLDRPGLGSEEAVQRLSRVPLQSVPGTRWAYSAGIDVVGWAIEAITGARLGEVVRELVTAPLGLTDTGFGISDPARALPAYYANGTTEPVRITDGFVSERNGFRTSFAPSRISDPASYHSGGAGLAGTAEDVLAFLEAVRLGRLLRPETVALMRSPQAGIDTTAYGPGVAFGIGWAVTTDPAAAHTPQSAGTLQWGGAYGHSWFVDPVRRLTVVALTNTGPEGLFGSFTRDLRDAVYASY